MFSIPGFTMLLSSISLFKIREYKIMINIFVSELRFSSGSQCCGSKKEILGGKVPKKQSGKSLRKTIYFSKLLFLKASALW